MMYWVFVEYFVCEFLVVWVDVDLIFMCSL